MKYILSSIYQFMADNLMIYAWRDCVEIILLAAVIYYFSRWLNTDQTKRPIIAFYGYFLLVACAYYANLVIVSTLLLFASPVFLMLLIVMHQQVLQKHFVAYRSIRPILSSNDAWIDELMRACLSALNKQKEIVCLIEQDDDLKDFIEASYYLNADLKKTVIDLLLEHIPDGGTSVLWLHSAGRVIAFNARIKNSPDAVWVAPEVKELPLWKHDALFLTSKTDAVVMKMSSTTRLFDCIVEGKAVEGLTAPHVLVLLKQKLKKQTRVQKDVYFHAHQNRNFTEQHFT